VALASVLALETEVLVLMNPTQAGIRMQWIRISSKDLLVWAKHHHGFHDLEVVADYAWCNYSVSREALGGRTVREVLSKSIACALQGLSLPRPYS
jgi:hypothetical protein